MSKRYTGERMIVLGGGGEGEGVESSTNKYRSETEKTGINVRYIF